jgi:fructose-1,6-bisphosphatase/inositol monophosphatase family enzyme
MMRKHELNQSEVLEYDELERRIITAAYNAGRYAKEKAFAISDLQFKIGEDPVTEVDKDCERMIIKELGFAYNYLGEEFGFKDNGSQILIRMDPIDGTKSYTKGELNCATAISATNTNNIGTSQEYVVSVIYDFTRDIAYVANQKGAYLLTPQGVKKPLPNRLHEYKKKTIYSTKLEKLESVYSGRKANITSAGGGVSLFMAQAAAGIYDAFHSPPYKKDGAHDLGDILAGIHIMTQAGMTVVDYYHDPIDLERVDNGVLAWRGECPFERYLKEGAIDRRMKAMSAEAKRIRRQEIISNEEQNSLP